MLWQTPKFFPSLKAGQIHIWRTSSARLEGVRSGFESMLNQQEKDRAARFIVSDAANNFIEARGILRVLLGRYLSLPPKDVVLSQNKYGKLHIEGSPLKFNLSHSQDLSLFIFALNNSVGVDVEFIRDNYEFADIAKKFFSKQEVEDLFALPQEERLLAFFNCWSRKEAFIKGLGLGMFKELHNFSVEVSVKKVGKAKLLVDDDDQNWSLEALDPGSQYSGAFAVDCSDYKAGFYDFSY